MPRFLSHIALLCLLAIFENQCAAQHDPQRNATRLVAAGQFDKVGKELAKADEDEPETHFLKFECINATYPIGWKIIPTLWKQWWSKDDLQTKDWTLTDLDFCLKGNDLQARVVADRS